MCFFIFLQLLRVLMTHKVYACKVLGYSTKETQLVEKYCLFCLPVHTVYLSRILKLFQHVRSLLLVMLCEKGQNKGTSSLGKVPWTDSTPNLSGLASCLSYLIIMRVPVSVPFRPWVEYIIRTFCFSAGVQGANQPTPRRSCSITSGIPFSIYFLMKNVLCVQL
jgi:hypothetical protein